MSTLATTSARHAKNELEEELRGRYGTYASISLANTDLERLVRDPTKERRFI